MSGLTRTVEPIHLAVALDGAGWHPAAWREPGARPLDLFIARYWADLTETAERGLLDVVTIEDGLDLQSEDPFTDDADTRTDQVRGRLDALLVAASVAPQTQHIGLVPTVTTTTPSRSTSPRRSPPSTMRATDAPGGGCSGRHARRDRQHRPTRPSTAQPDVASSPEGLAALRER